MKIPPSILRYWAAMNASALQSAAHSGKAYIAVAIAHASVGSIPALSWVQLCAVFGLAFLIGLFDWLDEHPLTDLLPPPAAANPPTTIQENKP